MSALSYGDSFRFDSFGGIRKSESAELMRSQTALRQRLPGTTARSPESSRVSSAPSAESGEAPAFRAPSSGPVAGVAPVGQEGLHVVVEIDLLRKSLQDARIVAHSAVTSRPQQSQESSEDHAGSDSP